MNILRQLSVGVALLVHTSCADAKPVSPLQVNGHVARSGDWAVGCDSTGRCAAIGVPSAAYGHPPNASIPYEMGIAIHIDTGSYALEELEIFPSSLAQLDEPELFRIDGLPTDMGREFRFVFGRKALPPQSAFELMRMLKASRAVRGVNDKTGDVRIRFPEVGLPAAMRAMDKQRHRFDEAKSSINTPPQNRQQNKMQPIPASTSRGWAPLTKMESDLPCDPDRGAARVQAYIMVGGGLLFRLQCNLQGLNEKSYWFEATGKNARAQLLVLPEPRDGALAFASDGLSNSSFNPGKGILQAIEFGSSKEDCGTRRRWAITAIGWKLLERREMPICGSQLGPEDWIRTYRSRTVVERPRI